MSYAERVRVTEAGRRGGARKRALARVEAAIAQYGRGATAEICMLEVISAISDMRKGVGHG